MILATFDCEVSRSYCINKIVRRSIAILYAVLLVIWIPASSLCLIENAGLIMSSCCCDESSSSDLPTCCALASSAYKLDDTGQALVAPLLSASFLGNDLDQFDFKTSSELAVTLDVSPPETCHSWQFCSRAAASPRAPSLAS